MKKILFALAAVLVLTALGAGADEPVVERQIKLKILTDAGEPVGLDLGDMTVGDTRQFFTDGGTEVTVTRLESAFEIQVEGEDEPLVVALPEGPHGDHSCDGDDCDHHVIVHKIVRGDGADATAMFHGGDGQHVIIDHGEDVSWVGGEGDGPMTIHAITGDPAARLIESGVLDDLSPEKRQAILDALRGPHDGHAKTVTVIKRRAGGDEEQ